VFVFVKKGWNERNQTWWGHRGYDVRYAGLSIREENSPGGRFTDEADISPSVAKL
jgi:hypothetical protein